MRVRYTLPAARSLARVLSYIAEHTPQGAKHVKARIQASIELLAQFPLAGHLLDRGRRRLIVTPYPYVIFYRVGDDEIVIHAVRHTARRPVATDG